MAPEDGMSNKTFHEFPLVLFTALAIAGAGIGVAHICMSLMRWSDWVPKERLMVLVGSLLGLGLVVSMGHLGRPLRGPLALSRVGKSPLSNEVLVVSLAALASLLTIAFPQGGPTYGALGTLALVCSFLTLLSLGFVYRLPGQLSWAGAAPFHPLIQGLGFGLAVLLNSLPEGAEARGALLFLFILFLDGILIWERTRRIGRALGQGIPAQPRFMAQRGGTVSLRILMGVLLPAVAVLWNRPGLAVVSLAMSLLLDRFLFYGLAVLDNTESEVARVEAALSLPNLPPG